MYKRLLQIFIALFCLINTSQALSPSSSREYWVSTFGMNKDSAIAADSTLQQFWVLVSSKNGCTGTITNPNTGYSKSFTVAPNSVSKVGIPYIQVYNHSDTDSVFVSKRSILVTTSDSAAVYLGNYQQSTYDATAVFPVKSLGVSYRVIMSNHPKNFFKQYYDNTAAINIISTEDNTILKFNLADTVKNGNETYLPNVDYYKTLNKGEVLNIVGLKLLGSSFESTNCHKIAVFSGNYCSQIPYNCLACDLLVEQIPPVNTWGQRFMVRSTLKRVNDSRIYITANEDNTLVTINKPASQYTFSLNSGEYVDINSDTIGIDITSSKPIAVVQFAEGVQLSKRGDPMMMWINPNEQMIREAIFAAPPTVHVTNHYIQLFVNTTDISNTYLDGVNIASAFSIFSLNTNYAVARIEISPTTHHIKNTGGFLGYVYGYDSGAYLTQESYGYSLNDVFHNTQDYFSIEKSTFSGSNISYQTSNQENSYQINDTITISRTTLSKYDSISWLLNNRPYITNPKETSSSTFSWKLPASDLTDGENIISMLVHRSCMIDTISSSLWLRSANINIDGNNKYICPGDSVTLLAKTNINNATFIWTTKTKTLTSSVDSIRVSPSTNTQYYVCAKYGNYTSALDSISVNLYETKYAISDSITACSTYNFNGNILTGPGTYIDTLTSSHGCDSIITLSLKQVQITTHLKERTCFPKTFTFNGKILNTSGVYRDTLLSIGGCDSLLILNFVVDTLRSNYTDSICSNEVYYFNGQSINSPGVYQTIYSTVMGCDSLVSLNLILKQPININISRPICKGSFIFGTQTISSAGVYTEHFSTSLGCDSMVTLSVYQGITDTTYIEQTINHGESYNFNNLSLTEAGIYQDTLNTIYNCDSLIVLKLNVKMPDMSVEIPEGFSPNGDGVNDYFVIKNLENYPNNHIWIFNRWGNKLFEGSPYLNNWDGTSHYSKMNVGDLPPNGTYFYILELGDGSKPRKGWVWLER